MRKLCHILEMCPELPQTWTLAVEIMPCIKIASLIFRLSFASGRMPCHWLLEDHAVCPHWLVPRKPRFIDWSRENHVSCRALQSCNPPGDWARELFKPSTDSASLVVEIEKKMLSFRWGTPQVGVFLATFSWPWAPTYWAIIMAQDFYGN